VEPEGVAASPDGRWIYVTAEGTSTIAVIDARRRVAVGHILVGSRPRVAVFSSDSSRAFVTAENAGTLSVIDVKSHSVTATKRLPGSDAKPVGIALAPGSDQAYVANGRANNVVLVELASLRIVAEIPVGKRVWGIGITPDGRKVYAANSLSNDVSVIDTASNRVVSTIPAGNGPWGVAVLRESRLRQ
jgi:YVTN family beta-propeller protein